MGMDLDRQLEDLLNPDAQVGEKVGWRAWYVYQQGSMVRLASLKSGHRSETLWTPGEWMEAKCAKLEVLGAKGLAAHLAEIMVHKVVGARLPVEDCSCGWYAAIDRDHLVSLGYNRYGETARWSTDSSINLTRCIGEVAMIGKVIEATQGWRAEMVRPCKLYLPYEKWKLAKPLEETYGIPVELSNLWDGSDE